MAKKPKHDEAATGANVTGKACSILPDTVLGDDVALVAENMERILGSPSYSLAQDDRLLLTREEMRGVRMLLELGKPEIALQADNIKSTVIVFGGTQIVDRSAAERRLSEARRAAHTAPADRAIGRDVERAERLLSMCRYYDDARRFARIVSIDNQCEDERDYVIITGGGPGIMEAANRGAFDVGCKSIGLNIKLPAEQQPNPFITPELCFQFKYFALRKFHFILRAAAVVLFPGGFGTLDEMFETLTLRQTHRMQPVPIILYGRDYWSKVIDFRFLADSGVIADHHLDLFSYSETPEDAWQQILDFHAKKQRA
ncbi:MAG: LOG family protein [Planctomycetes bacterium]|nr:LOG family protein [Planctomycetota bacterium]